MNFTILPNLIALSVLVAVFWAISRRATTEPLHLWLAGWILVLLHFAAQFFAPSNQSLGRIVTAISLDSLVLATIAFLISVSTGSSTRPRQIALALAVAVPCIGYVNGVIWEVAHTSYYYILTVAGVLGSLLLLWRFSRARYPYAAYLMALVTLAGGITACTIAHGDPSVGVIVILAALNFVVAVLYWNRHKRVTAGVLTTVCGFVLWGAVFPVGALMETFLPSIRMESEVWNIPKYLVAMGMILTLLENQIERSNFLAYHDELTRLPNRRLLEDRLERALAYADRSGGKVAVFLLDLDRFKEVNDTFGHRVGDLALQAVASRLAARIRTSDTLARSGGDEFTVVSAVPDISGAEALVTALESALSAPIHVQDDLVHTGLSIGLALYPDDGSNPDELHAAADKAMYVAKRAARMVG